VTVLGFFAHCELFEDLVCSKAEKRESYRAVYLLSGNGVLLSTFLGGS
jgi:hypothetical protein